MSSFFRFNFLCLLTCLTLVACNIEGKTESNKKLVPIAKKQLWGLSTVGGKIVVPCEYETFEFDSSYFVMKKSSDSMYWYLYTNEGKLVTKAEMVVVSNDYRPVFFNKSKVKTDEMSAFFESEYGSAGTLDFWNDCGGYTGQLVNKDNTLTPLEGEMYAFTWPNSRDPKQPFFLLLHHGDKTGVYDMRKGKYIVPMAFRFVKSLPFGVFLTTDSLNHHHVFNVDGDELVYKPNFEGAKSIPLNEQLSIKTNRPQLPEGDELFSVWYAKDNVVKERNGELKRHESSNKTRNVFDFVNAQKEVLLQNIIDAEQITSDHYLIKRIDTTRMREMKLGVYSVSEKRFVYPFEDSDNYSRYTLYKGLIIEHFKGTKTYYAPNHQCLGVINDNEAFSQREWNVFNVFELNNENQLGTYRMYYAIRPDTNAKYKLYNKAYELVSEDFEGLRESSHYYTLTFKKGGKWGLLSAALQEIIPPMYDKPLSPFHFYGYTSAILPVEKDGRKYHVDMHNRPVFGQKDFSFINDNEVNGKWLALDHDEVKTRNFEAPPKPQVKHIYIIDSAGNKVFSKACDDNKNTIYELTADLKILTHPREYYYNSDGIKLYDPVSDRTNSFGKPGRIISYKGIPLLIQTTEKGGEHERLYSVKDFKEVHIPKKYLFYRTREFTFSNSDNARRGLLLIGVNKNNEESQNLYQQMLKHMSDETEEIVGFYSLDGVLYNAD